MYDQSEEELNRLTPTGWGVLVGNCLICCVVAPFMLVWLCPSLLEAGGRIQKYTIAAGFLILCGGGCFVCKWLLEKCGITVLRPAPLARPCERQNEQ